MRLGAMLIRDGRLTEAQLDAAIAQQARVGGRLGTVLVEMKLLDVDTLTVYLGLDLGIPIATRAAMERAKRAAVRLLSPELAERFLCVPLITQDRQLIAAMRDPHDLLALDELVSATGYRVIPRVSPEIRLWYYVERYYGVPRPERYRALGDAVAAGTARTADFMEPPPPPLPGLPPEKKNPIVAPPLVPVVRSVQPMVVQSEDDYDELATEMDADQDEPAGVAEATAHPPVEVLPAEEAPSAGHGTGTEEILELEPALARMAEAGSRSEIADAVISYARGVFDLAILLVVRDELAIGWKGFGRKVDAERIESLLIPLGVPSMFKAALDQGGMFAAYAPPTTIHSHMFKLLRATPPRQGVVAAISIKDRAVNLLYGHLEGEAVISTRHLEGLKKLSEAASAAYVRLIALQKQSA